MKYRSNNPTILRRKVMKTRGFTNILLVVLLSLTGCEDSNSKTEIPKELRPVKYITVQPHNTGLARTFSGVSKAQYEASLSFRVSGVIKKMNVKVGDILKSGDLIAILDKLPSELEEQKARASLAQSQADRRNGESKYQRVKELYENNNASKSDLDSARASVESFRAQVRSSKKSLKLAQLDLEYTSLKTNHNCMVAEIFKEENENIKAGDPIASVTCGKKNEVEILVPEKLIANIQKGMKATIEFDSIVNAKFQATVSEVSISSNSGVTYPVILTIDNQKRELRSGLTAEVRFMFSEKESATNMYLPPFAIGEDSKGRYVFVLENANKAGEAVVRRQDVKIGELTSEGLEIIDGVKQSQKIVTAGISVIHDGMIVKVD